jgi:aryl-alcohol dehydrogenase-like predicted oxidoreductase
MSPSREQLERDGTVEELVSLRDEGKVRLLGMSGIEPNLADHIAMGVFDVFQIPYSALQRGHEALISQAADGGAGLLIRGGVARGTASQEKGWSVRPLAGLHIEPADPRHEHLAVLLWKPAADHR